MRFCKCPQEDFNEMLKIFPLKTYKVTKKLYFCTDKNAKKWYNKRFFIKISK